MLMFINRDCINTRTKRIARSASWLKYFIMNGQYADFSPLCECGRRAGQGRAGLVLVVSCAPSRWKGGQPLRACVHDCAAAVAAFA